MAPPQTRLPGGGLAVYDHHVRTLGASPVSVGLSGKEPKTADTGDLARLCNVLRIVKDEGPTAKALAFLPGAAMSKAHLSGFVRMLALLGMAGCSFTPALDRPAPALPDAWSAATAAWRMPGRVQSGWWRAFGSDELTALEQAGLAGNANLAAAIARIEEARGAAQVAGAAQYPAIALGATLDRNGSKRTRNAQSVFASASYEIDFWGKNRALAQSGAALADASRADAQTVLVSLTASIADAYFQVLSLRERVSLAQRIADDARRVLALVEIQQQVGTIATVQVEQQRSAVATFDAAVPALRQALDQQLHALAVLTGRLPEGFDVAGRGLDGIALPSVPGDRPATLLERRPDIQAAEARLVSANFDVGAARAAFFPDVTLTGQTGLAATSLSQVLPPAALADIALAALQPVFQGGRLRGQLRTDRARVGELGATYRQSVLAGFQDVEDQFTAIARLREQGDALQIAVASADHAASLAEAQFHLGAIDYLTVLTTERALYQARDSLLQVRVGRLQAQVGLYRALGGGAGAVS